MFSLSFRDEVSAEMMTEVSPIVRCSDQNCTALFLIDPAYENFYNLTINVTVSGEDCSNSVVKMTSGVTSKLITNYIILMYIVDSSSIVNHGSYYRSKELGFLLKNISLTKALWNLSKIDEIIIKFSLHKS